LSWQTECFRCQWEHRTGANGGQGAALVTHGKTNGARRILPMTPRVRAVLEARWASANQPDEGWIFAARTKSGHVEKSTLKKRHRKVFERVNEEAKKNEEKPLRPFVL